MLYGDIAVLAMPTIFKKIRFDTHDNIGSGPIHITTRRTTYIFHVGIHLMYLKDGQMQMLTDAMTGAAYAIQSFIPLFVQM